jgi:hypothetical protein
MHIEYLSAHHDKSSHPAYVMVPKIAAFVMRSMPDVTGFVFGGSYANGKYAWGEDIDFDLLLDAYPVGFNRDLVSFPIRRAFNQQAFNAHLRAPLAANSISESLRVSTYDKHPNSPYVVRDSQILKLWGLK